MIRMSNYEWSGSAVTMREVSDATGGLNWLAPDGVPAGDVAPVQFTAPDTSLLPHAGPGAYVWGGDAA